MDTPLPKLLVFGEALTDFVRSGESTWHSTAGGSCWNVARVASTLGIATGWAGAVSNDIFGNDIIERSRAARLDMRFLQTVDASPLIAMVYQSTPPKYFFLGENSADLHFDEQKLPKGWKDACEIAHFGCISLVRQPLGKRLTGIAESLKSKGKKICFDPNYRQVMGPNYVHLFEHMASLADFIKASDEDLAQIYPKLSLAKAVSRVRSIAPKAAIICTRGADGIVFHDQGDDLEIPAFKVNVADTVGAGDACIGGFLASIMNAPDHSPEQHLRFAAATAAITCTKSGAHAPTRAEIEHLINLSY